MWQQEVQDKAVCSTEEVDEMLQPPGPPLLAGLSYLTLLHEAQKQDAKGILTMKKGRKRGEADLERDYHSHMLTIFQVQDLMATFVWLCCTLLSVILTAVKSIMQKTLFSFFSPNVFPPLFFFGHQMLVACSGSCKRSD